MAERVGKIFPAGGCGIGLGVIAGGDGGEDAGEDAAGDAGRNGPLFWAGLFDGGLFPAAFGLANPDDPPGFPPLAPPPLWELPKFPREMPLETGLLDGRPDGGRLGMRGGPFMLPIDPRPGIPPPSAGRPLLGKSIWRETGRCSLLRPRSPPPFPFPLCGRRNGFLAAPFGFFTTSLTIIGRPFNMWPESVCIKSCPRAGSRNIAIAKQRLSPVSGSITRTRSSISVNEAVNSLS